jgi:hypothetical protein
MHNSNGNGRVGTYGVCEDVNALTLHIFIARHSP